MVSSGLLRPTQKTPFFIVTTVKTSNLTGNWLHAIQNFTELESRNKQRATEDKLSGGTFIKEGVMMKCLYFRNLMYTTVQTVPSGNASILEGNIIGHSKQKK
jgi:hypothetical protein